MGEEAKPVVEQAPAEAKTEEKTKEEPQPPSPVILAVDLHCAGCAKKIQRSIMKIKGVEGVDIDMPKNQVTIKGIILDPQAVCDKLMNRTKRKVKLLSPLPPAPEAAAPQVPGIMTTVELNVNMHCEACAEQLKRKLLQMRGVQTAETELSSGKVVVTGTMDAGRLVEYVYRRTKKKAKIVPQPEPKKEADDDRKPNKEEAKLADEHKKEDENNNNSEGKKDVEKPAEEAKKELGGEESQKGGAACGTTEDEELQVKGGEDGKSTTGIEDVLANIEEESLKKMIYYYQPLYVIETERIPPPQLFSDENPNACCIS